jgi:GTP-binding protein HflX
VTEEVLEEIGAKEVPRLLVFNKIDRGGNEAELRAALLALHPGCIVISARRPEDIARLREAVLAFFRRDLVEADILLPWSMQRLRGEIFGRCEVLQERHAEEGAYFRIRGEPEAVRRLRARLDPPAEASDRARL